MAKTNWTMGETVLPDDMNQIGQEINDLSADGSVTDNKIGNRTISDAAAPTGDTAKPTTLFGWLAYVVKAVTGEASWRTAPSITLKAIKSMFDNATAAATPDTLVKRDADGKFKATIPTDPQHVARKADVDLMTPRNAIALIGASADGTDVKTYAWQTGFYEVGPNTANMPVINNWWRVWSTVAEANNISLIAMATNGGAMFSVVKTNGVWSTWREIFTTNGGTITGNVVLTQGGGTGLFQQDTGTTPRLLARVNSSNQVLLGDTALPAFIQSYSIPIWYDGTTTRKLVPEQQFLADGVDFNTVTTSGFYRFNQIHANVPASLTYGQLLVCHGGGDTIMQFASGVSDGRVYFRNGNPPNVGGSGAWSPWVELISSQGGTVTGTLNTNGAFNANGGMLLPNSVPVSGKRTDGVPLSLIVVGGDSNIGVGSASAVTYVHSSQPPKWYNGSVVRDFIHTGGGQTIGGNLIVNGQFGLGAVTGEKFYVYDGGAGASKLGIGVDMTGNSNELTLFHSTGSGSEGRISFGRRRADNGVYTETMSLDAYGGLTTIGGFRITVPAGEERALTWNLDANNYTYFWNRQSDKRFGLFSTYNGTGRGVFEYDPVSHVFNIQTTSLNHNGNTVRTDANSPRVTTSSSAPGSPRVGDVWIDTSS